MKIFKIALTVLVIALAGATAAFATPSGSRSDGPACTVECGSTSASTGEQDGTTTSDEEQTNSTTTSNEGDGDGDNQSTTTSGDDEQGGAPAIRVDRSLGPRLQLVRRS